MSGEQLSFSKTEVGSDKNFGFVFSVLFFVLGFYRWYLLGFFEFYCFLVAAALVSVSIFFPRVLRPLNVAWFRFGLLLAKFTSPIFLCLIYFLAFMPTAVVLTVLRKDILGLRYDDKCETYWIERKDPLNNMKDQF